MVMSVAQGDCIWPAGVFGVSKNTQGHIQKILFVT
jgi:hypothetical protein